MKRSIGILLLSVPLILTACGSDNTESESNLPLTVKTARLYKAIAALHDA